MRLRYAIATPLAGALVITVLGGWLLRWAWADVPLVEFHACSSKTCAAISEETQRALAHGETLYIKADQVLGVGSMPGCDDCSKLRLAGGLTVYVIGCPGTVSCKLVGGPGCQAKETK